MQVRAQLCQRTVTSSKLRYRFSEKFSLFVDNANALSVQLDFYLLPDKEETVRLFRALLV